MITINELETILDTLEIDADIVYAESGDEFQEYVDADGNDIAEGTPIGIESGDTIVLFENVFYKND